MKKLLYILPALISCAQAPAQTAPWSMDKCMAYAADHSTSVRQARWDLAAANATHTEAIGDFLPSLSASVGAQLNWGRNIDPETNTYNNVTTFNNGYGLYASVTIFDGGRTLNRYRQARAERSRSRNAVEMQRDDRAMAAMMAYADAVYYLRAITIAEDKADQSRATLRLVERQEQMGIKGLPDVAQARSAVAQDEYALVHQRNLYTQAMLTLRSVMNLPLADSLAVDTAAVHVPQIVGSDRSEEIYAVALGSNPQAIDALLSVKTSEYAYKMSKSQLMPSISLNAGISTSYYKTITGGGAGPRFSEQFKNNRGEYLSASLSIPIFSGFSRISSVKRAKYALESAKLAKEDRLRRLHDDIVAAVNDRDGYAAEIRALETKVESDALAFSLNRKKHEEGLLSLIDLQISANTYYDSRVQLLQRRMLFLLKSRIVDYYKGEPLY